MRSLPNNNNNNININHSSSSSLTHQEATFIQSALQGIVSDELTNINDDLLWEYDGLRSQPECEDILLEMQNIFYQDLELHQTTQQISSEDDEDDYLARLVYLHMQLNDGTEKRLMIKGISKRDGEDSSSISTEDVSRFHKDYITKFSGVPSKDKGGEVEGLGTDDLHSPTKSLLLTKQAPKENIDNRKYHLGGKDVIFTVGQSLKVCMGTFKGYHCQIMALSNSEIMVKLDSHSNIIAVKPEHLLGVHLRNSAKPSGLASCGRGESSGWKGEDTQKHCANPGMQMGCRNASQAGIQSLNDVYYC